MGITKLQKNIIVILQGLSQEYDNFVQVLTLNAKTLKVDEIAISLIQEENRRSEKKQESKNSEGDVFYSKEKQYKRRKNAKYTVKCYNCIKTGHISKDHQRKLEATKMQI